MTAPLVVQSLATGDYFRLWPDGRACTIDSEDDLRDARGIAKLEPGRKSTQKFYSAEQGDRFVLWTLEDCDECGAGEDRPTHDHFDDTAGWARERYCRACDNQNRVYVERGVLIARSELPYDATAVAAFAPLSLDLLPEMVLDLTGAVR